MQGGKRLICQSIALTSPGDFDTVHFSRYELFGDSSCRSFTITYHDKSRSDDHALNTVDRQNGTGGDSPAN